VTMARYKATGMASTYLNTTFEDDGARDLYDQAASALREMCEGQLPWPVAVEIYDCIEIGQLTLGDMIKKKVARARAWVMGRSE